MLKKLTATAVVALMALPAQAETYGVLMKTEPVRPSNGVSWGMFLWLVVPCLIPPFIQNLTPSILICRTIATILLKASTKKAVASIA